MDWGLLMHINISYVYLMHMLISFYTVGLYRQINRHLTENLHITLHGIVCSDEMCGCNNRSRAYRGYATAQHRLAVKGHTEWGTCTLSF